MSLGAESEYKMKIKEQKRKNTALGAEIKFWFLYRTPEAASDSSRDFEEIIFK